MTVDDWLRELAAALGVGTEPGTEAEADVDTQGLLDLARDAAHGVARPAAPLTTYLVGYAAGRAAGSGGDPKVAVAEAIATATRLARALDEPAPDG